jgi:hypothetical protein
MPQINPQTKSPVAGVFHSRTNVLFWPGNVVKLTLVERKPVTHSATQERPTVGVIEAISTGFDRVLHQPWLMIIPIVLDVFLWVGPRLQAPALYDQFAPSLKTMAADLDTDGQLAVQEMGKLLKEFFSQFNLFSWLSVSVVGVPAVNTAIDASSPLVTGGPPTLLPLGDVKSYLLVLVALSAIGLVLGGLFWAMLAGPVRDEPFDAAAWLRNGLTIGGQLVALGVLTLIAVGLGMILLLFLMAIIGAISLELASFLPTLLITAAVWVVFYLAFTVHGLALYRLTLNRALRTSALIARVYFASTLGLAALSVVIYLGLGLIWKQFIPGSWLRLIAMAGHAFIAASLATASLIYYQNRSASLFDRLQLPQPGGS